jgi:hypothetical protein
MNFVKTRYHSVSKLCVLVWKSIKLIVKITKLQFYLLMKKGCNGSNAGFTYHLIDAQSA